MQIMRWTCVWNDIRIEVLYGKYKMFRYETAKGLTVGVIFACVTNNKTYASRRKILLLGGWYRDGAYK